MAIKICHLWAVSFSACAYLGSAHAVTGLSKNYPTEALVENFLGMVVPTTMVDKKEKRKPLDAAGRKRYAASGYMVCPEGQVNVQVVGNPPAAVLTSAHQFIPSNVL